MLSDCLKCKTKYIKHKSKGFKTSNGIIKIDIKRLILYK